mgnify:CR=1 FL=1
MIEMKTKKRRRKERRKRMITAGVLLIGSSLFLWICILGVRNTSLWNRLQYQICYLMLKQYAPVLTAGDGDQTAYQIEDDTTMYDMQSEVSCLMIRFGKKRSTGDTDGGCFCWK